MLAQLAHMLHAVRAKGAHEVEENRAVPSRFFVCVASALLLMQPALTVPVLAAELRGFGLIKFGMTEAEAWDAVGGEATWEDIQPELRRLSYRYSVEEGLEDWEVSHLFRADRAIHGHAFHFSEVVSGEVCLARGARIAEKIEAQHGVSPFVRKGTPFYDLADFGRDDAYRILHIYNFTFDKGAYIWILATVVSTGICDVIIFFGDSITEPIPF